MNKTENILTTALEECAEIQQAISKAMRFGMNAHHPMKPDHTNAHDILTEYYQLQAVMELLQKDGILPILPENEITAIKQHKLEAMRQYQNISVLNGCLDIRPAVPAKTIENTNTPVQVAPIQEQRFEMYKSDRLFDVTVDVYPSNVGYGSIGSTTPLVTFTGGMSD